MWRKDIEVILARLLASYLSMPIFIVDPDGNLLYYNEPAELVLGKRFAETGMMTPDEWSDGLTPTNKDGSPVPQEEVPLMVALRDQRPAHHTMWIKALDDEPHLLNVWAFPLTGLADRFVGALMIFWKVE